MGWWGTVCGTPSQEDVGWWGTVYGTSSQEDVGWWGTLYGTSQFRAFFRVTNKVPLVIITFTEAGVNLAAVVMLLTRCDVMMMFCNQESCS